MLRATDELEVAGSGPPRRAAVVMQSRGSSRLRWLARSSGAIRPGPATREGMQRQILWRIETCQRKAVGLLLHVDLFDAPRVNRRRVQHSSIHGDMQPDPLDQIVGEAVDHWDHQQAQERRRDQPAAHNDCDGRAESGIGTRPNAIGSIPAPSPPSS